MLYKDTKILTVNRGLQCIKDLDIGEEIVTLYGKAEVLNLTSSIEELKELIIENSDKIYCSIDQKFLIKTNVGYSFYVPIKSNQIVTFTDLMELRAIQQVNILSSGEVFKLHIKNDYSVLVNGLYITKS